MLQALKKPFWISGPTSSLDLRQALKGKPLLQGFSIFLQSVVIVFFGVNMDSLLSLLAAGYTLLRQEHVKIDVVSGRFSKRTQIWIDIAGICFFLIPFVTYIIILAMPLVINAFITKEMSSNAGGLMRWPVFAMLPLGLLLLGIQGVSEVIKRFAFLQGMIPDPSKKPGVKTPEEEFAEFLLQKEVAAREAVQMGAQK